MIKAKKHFGQNFLKDEAVLSKIIQAIPKDTEYIVEIGPGLGDLTKELVKKAKVRAYEIDLDLIPFLEDKFSSEIKNGSLQIVSGDVLQSFEKGLFEKEYFLCANLPYYIATNIILNALKDELCSGILVMVQKEVAQRFIGEDFCQLSVLCRCICDGYIVCDVLADSFVPPPKVTSAVIYLSKNKNYKDIFVDDFAFNSFCIFLKDSFSSPRKKLVSNLKGYQNIKDILSSLNIDENIRPHELCVELFLDIFKRIYDERRKK